MVSFNPVIADKLNGLSQGVLDGHYIFNREIDDGYLAKRFSKPDVIAHNVRISCVNSEKHIQQYYAIREKTYVKSVGAGFYAGQDEYDSKSHMVLALAGDNCIGGIRITVSSLQDRIFLPTENNNFQFSDIYGKLDFSHLTYCEATRLALLPDFRTNGILRMIFEEATKFAIETLGVQMVFGRSASTQTRVFQTQYRDMGYELVVREDVKPPSRGMDAPLVQIWAMDFTPAREYTEALKSYNNKAKASGIHEFA